MDDFTVPEQKSKLPFSGESDGLEDSKSYDLPPAHEAKENIDPSPLAGASEALEEEAAKSEPKPAKKLFTEEELDKFWDCTLGNTPYTESTSFGKGSRKLQVTFKTKGTSELDEIAAYMEEESIAMKDRWNFVHSQYLLGVGLHSYNRKMLPKEPTADRAVVQLRLDFVRELPLPVFNSLIEKLRTFDIKVASMQAEVFSEDF